VAVDGTTAARPHPEGYGFFFNTQGLRAGWRVLLLVFLFIAFTLLFSLFVWPFTRTPVPNTANHGELRPLAILLQKGVDLGSVLAAAFLVQRIEERPLLAMPFTGSRKVLRFVSGFAIGFAAITALVGTLAARHLLMFDAGTLASSTAVRYGLIWLAVFVLVAAAEEAFFRGYMQTILAGGMGFWGSALLLAAAFGLLHHGNASESPVGLFAAAMVSLLLALSVWFTGSLWWAIGFHAAWDWGQSFLYGTPDSGVLVRGHYLSSRPHGSVLLSGGETGPEGSIYAVGLLVLLILFAYLWWRGRVPAEWPQRFAPHDADRADERHEAQRAAEDVA
jgi:membrane protease YdiL (CAAX protease family)